MSLSPLFSAHSFASVTVPMDSDSSSCPSTETFAEPAPRLPPPCLSLSTPSTPFDPYAFHALSKKREEWVVSSALDRQGSDQTVTSTVCTLQTDPSSFQSEPVYLEDLSLSITHPSVASSIDRIIQDPLSSAEEESPLLSMNSLAHPSVLESVMPSSLKEELQNSLLDLLQRFSRFAEPLITCAKEKVNVLHTNGWTEPLFYKCQALFEISLAQLCEHIQTNKEQREKGGLLYDETGFHQKLVCSRIQMIRSHFFQKLREFDFSLAANTISLEITVLQGQLRFFAEGFTPLEKAKEAVYRYETEITVTVSYLIGLLDTLSQTQNLETSRTEQGKIPYSKVKWAWNQILTDCEKLFGRTPEELFDYIQAQQNPPLSRIHPKERSQFAFLTPCLQRIERAGEDKPFEEKIQEQLQEMQTIQENAKHIHQRFIQEELSASFSSLWQSLQKNTEEIRRLLSELEKTPTPFYQEQGQKVALRLAQDLSFFEQQLKKNQSLETYQKAFGLSITLLSLLKAYQDNSSNTMHDLYFSRFNG